MANALAWHCCRRRRAAACCDDNSNDGKCLNSFVVITYAIHMNTTVVVVDTCAHFTGTYNTNGLVRKPTNLNAILNAVM